MPMIRELRVAKGWNQSRLSVEAKLGLQTIRRLEKGTRDKPVGANASTLELVSQALGVSPNDIEGVSIVDRVSRKGA